MDAAVGRVVIIPPGSTPPRAIGRPPDEKPTMVVHFVRPPPAFFRDNLRLTEDLYARLHAAVQGEIDELFGSVTPGTQPFDLISGEVVNFPPGGQIIASGPTPRPTD